ncbi:MAG TPA: hypothetical protein VMP89_10950 [Solirubrobacteraceae bacterium]|nr:hypothetical protein [Solirubrobacteraceae bacterium]
MSMLRRRRVETGDPAGENHWESLNRLFARIGGPRPHYTWSLIHATLIAERLGFPRVSALELGVAGGNGLVALESAADVVSEAIGVGIEVHGFDSGRGLPPPVDHRDAPYLIGTGDFSMDEQRLRARLRRATLHLGPIGETVAAFLRAGHPPVAFAAFDLDYYSSTRDALALVAGPTDRLMPRFLAYFDDVLGYPWGFTNGPMPAIAQFNSEHGATRLVDELRGLRYVVPRGEFDARWTEAMFLVHVLDHPRYDDAEGTAFSNQLELD